MFLKLQEYAKHLVLRIYTKQLDSSSLRQRNSQNYINYFDIFFCFLIKFLNLQPKQRAERYDSITKLGEKLWENLVSANVFIFLKYQIKKIIEKMVDKQSKIILFGRNPL